MVTIDFIEDEARRILAYCDKYDEDAEDVFEKIGLEMESLATNMNVSLESYKEEVTR